MFTKTEINIQNIWASNSKVPRRLMVHNREAWVKREDTNKLEGRQGEEGKKKNKGYAHSWTLMWLWDNKKTRGQTTQASQVFSSTAFSNGAVSAPLQESILSVAQREGRKRHVKQKWVLGKWEVMLAFKLAAVPLFLKSSPLSNKLWCLFAAPLINLIWAWTQCEWTYPCVCVCVCVQTMVCWPCLSY